MRIFVGMDLGSKSVKYQVQEESGRVLKNGSLGWEPAEWKGAFSRFGLEEMTVAFETGPEGYRAKAILEKWGVAVYPFHAANFPAVWRSKKKTDRIDASKICRALRAGGLPERVCLPSDEDARLRNLLTERDGYKKILLQLVNRVKGLGRQWGVAVKAYNRKNFSVWWEETMEAFPSGERPALERLYRVALGTLQTVEELEEEIQEQVIKAGHGERSQRLQTIPGVGGVVSAGVMAYLGDGKRFRSARKFTSYCGLAPSVSQTGEQDARLGHITKQGPPVLRWLFLQAANAAIRGRQLNQTKWKGWFTKLARRRGRKIAIVALARKIAETCYAIIRDETEWDPSRLRPTAP